MWGCLVTPVMEGKKWYKTDSLPSWRKELTSASNTVSQTHPLSASVCWFSFKCALCYEVLLFCVLFACTLKQLMLLLLSAQTDLCIHFALICCSVCVICAALVFAREKCVSPCLDLKLSCIVCNDFKWEYRLFVDAKHTDKRRSGGIRYMHWLFLICLDIFIQYLLPESHNFVVVFIFL